MSGGIGDGIHTPIKEVTKHDNRSPFRDGYK
jgi:hypothetical protein